VAIDDAETRAARALPDPDLAFVEVGLVIRWMETQKPDTEGVIQFTYDLFRVRPNDTVHFDPDIDAIPTGNVISAFASVDVLEAPVTAVPEPSLSFLAGILLAVNILLAKRTRKAIENKR
jgi:hypothetical protein